MNAVLSPVRVAVDDASQVGLARAAAGEAARASGLPTDLVDNVELAATELAQNLHRHAFGGDLLVLPPGPDPTGRVPGRDGLVLLAVDRGPGVDRFDRCLVDGYSTIGTLGSGLGAVRRLASRFDAVSEPGRGTVVMAAFDVGDGGDPRTTPGVRATPDDGAATPRSTGGAFDVGWVGFPVAPETVNGDDWSACRRGSRLVVVVADGLGHGPFAATASGAATATLAGHADRSPGRLLDAIDDAVRGTRGAAVSVVSLELDAVRHGGAMVTSGLGNVAIAVIGPDASVRRVATSHGTAGTHRHTTTAEASTAFPAGGTLVLHTDGLTSRWDLTGRGELLRHSATVVAAVLWRDHARGSDDSLVVVVRDGGGSR